jgi:hypothetical protein
VPVALAKDQEAHALSLVHAAEHSAGVPACTLLLIHWPVSGSTQWMECESDSLGPDGGGGGKGGGGSGAPPAARIRNVRSPSWWFPDAVRSAGVAEEHAYDTLL